MSTLLEQARDALHGFAELYDAADARQLVATIDEHAIVVKVVVARFNHNRKLRSVELLSGPPHVMRHIAEWPLYGTEGFNLFASLSEYGYEYVVTTEFQDVAALEMTDLLMDD